jgi:hypothetical protein
LGPPTRRKELDLRGLKDVPSDIGMIRTKCSLQTEQARVSRVKGSAACSADKENVPHGEDGTSSPRDAA